MATAKAGIQTLLKMGDGASPEVFTTIAACGDITGPSMSAGTYETTSHDTTTGYKTFITGLKDGGEISFPIYFDATDATHKDASTGLIGVFKATTVKNWQLLPSGYSPAVTWTFAGVITKLDFMYPVDGVQKANCTIKISGASTLA